MALITSAVIVGAATVYSGVQQRRAAQASRRAQRYQQRQAELAAARERRQAIKNARLARSSIEGQAAAQGLTGASSTEGAMGAVTSRTNENLSFLDQTGMLQRKANMANNAAASYTERAGIGQSVAAVAGSFGGYFGAGGGAASAASASQAAPAASTASSFGAGVARSSLSLRRG